MHELQEHLQNFLLFGQTEIEKHIVAPENSSAGERLAIYRDAYYIRLIASLRCNFYAAEEVGMKAASYLKNWLHKGMLVSS